MMNLVAQLQLKRAVSKRKQQNTMKLSIEGGKANSGSTMTYCTCSSQFTIRHRETDSLVNLTPTCPIGFLSITKCNKFLSTRNKIATLRMTIN